MELKSRHGNSYVIRNVIPGLTRLQIINNAVIMRAGIPKALHSLQFIGTFSKFPIMKIARNREPKINESSESNQLCKNSDWIASFPIGRNKTIDIAAV